MLGQGEVIRQSRFKLLVLLGIFWSVPSIGVPCTSSLADEGSRLYCNLSRISATVVSKSRLLMINQSMKRLAFQDLNQTDPANYKEMRFSSQPLLQHESNVNGGNPKKNLTIGNLTFDSDPKFFKKEAVTVGINLTGNVRYVFRRGFYGNVNAGTNLKHAIGLNERILSNQISSCVVKQVTGWNYVDVCTEKTFENKRFNQNHNTNFNFKYKRYYGHSDGSTKLFSFGLSKEVNGYEYQGVEISLNQIDLNDLGQNFAISARQSKKSSTPFGYTFGYKREIELFSNNVTFDAQYSFDLLLPVLGVRREDKRVGLGIKVPLSRRFDMALGYNVNDSSINYFDDRQLSVGIIFQ